MTVSNRDSSRVLGFIAASASLVAVFAASATPIPLYGVYRAADGLSYSDLSLTAVSYFSGAVLALLVFGRLSNHLGRRPVILLSLGLTALACLILLHVPSVAPLIEGRVLQGLSCGLASSATAAFLVDNAPSHPPWLGAAVSSSAPMVGLTMGALGSGALVEYGPLPRELPYLVALAFLVLCASLILASRETVSRQPGVLASLWPRLALPRAGQGLFPVAKLHLHRHMGAGRLLSGVRSVYGKRPARVHRCRHFGLGLFFSHGAERYRWPAGWAVVAGWRAADRHGRFRPFGGGDFDLAARGGRGAIPVCQRFCGRGTRRDPDRKLARPACSSKAR